MYGYFPRGMRIKETLCGANLVPGKEREERNTKIGLFPYLRESEMGKNTKFLNNVEKVSWQRGRKD